MVSVVHSVSRGRIGGLGFAVHGIVVTGVVVRTVVVVSGAVMRAMLVGGVVVVLMLVGATAHHLEHRSAAGAEEPNQQRGALAALGARVGITGRGQGRASAADIRATTPWTSCRRHVRPGGGAPLAAQVLGTHLRLEVLVNNAGGFGARRHVTADGLERTFALNHLAPFLLTSLLLDRLTASASARIVTVSSGARRRLPPDVAPT
jgi:NAD(P)-dependent dehydrogenase (short-subunit alcohol dehydrogenase family)